MPDIPLPKPQLPTKPTSPVGGSATPVLSQNQGSSTAPSIPPAAPTPAPAANSGLDSKLTPDNKPPVLGKPPVMPATPAPAQLPPKPAAAGLPPVPPQKDASSLPNLGATAGSAAAQPPKPPQPAAPKMASAGNPIKKFLPFILAVLLVLVIGGLGVWFLFLRGNQSTSVSVEPNSTGSSNRQQVPAQQTTLTYWGLWEPSEVMADIFTEFEAANPGVKVDYKKQSPTDYRSRLESSIANGSGPDLFRFHSSWVPMLREELAPLPNNIMSATEYQQTFYPIAAQMLNVQGQIVGIPLMYDGLGLYYNKQILSDANEQPPKTWAEVQELSQKLTIKDSNGDIKRAGVALGNASNVEHFSDILGLLMFQNGADPTDPTSQEAQDALLFYTQFVTKNQVWSDKLPSSTVAFARGDVAMMLAPSWRAHEIMSMNPDLQFGIVAAPSVGDQEIGWATFWAEGVNTNSKNKTMAWKLLDYLSQPEVLRKMYDAQSKTRAFGEIYPRVDMADELAKDSNVSAFLEDAPIARSWYMASYTHDNGLNDNMIKYYLDAVNSLLDGTNITSVVQTLGLGANQVLKQYGLK